MSLRILHSYKSFRPDLTGGVAEVISSLVSATPDYRHSIFVARTRGRSIDSTEGMTPVRAVWSLGELSSMPIAPSYPFALARQFANFDLIVHHAPFPLADVALLWPRPRCTGLIVYWHADIVRPNAVVSGVAPLLRRSLVQADRIIVSHTSVAENSPILRPYAHKCSTIPYSVDANYWSSLSEAQHQKAEALRTRFPQLVVAAGRLVPYKGFDVLLEAVRKLRAQLIIIGIGPQFDNLRQLIEQYGLQNRVFLVGHQSRDEMKIVFHAARAFAFPSTTAAEAFGLVQLEAMATGLPVVNTSLPTAVPHVARAGVEALTVPPRDSNALRDAIAYLLEHPTECARLGAAGAKRAVDSFSPSEFATRTRAVFDDAVKARETLRRSQSRSVPEKDAR